MKLRSTTQATKTRKYWENQAKKMKKFKLDHQKRTKIKPYTNNSFMNVWVIPTLKQFGSVVLQAVIFEMIQKTITRSVNV